MVDDSEPLGLELDYLTLLKDDKDDADLFQLALHQAVLNARRRYGRDQRHQPDPRRERSGCLPRPRQAVVASSPRDHHDGPEDGNHEKKNRFYVRMGNGTREIGDEAEVQKFIARPLGQGRTLMGLTPPTTDMPAPSECPRPVASKPCSVGRQRS